VIRIKIGMMRLNEKNAKRTDMMTQAVRNRTVVRRAIGVRMNRATEMKMNVVKSVSIVKMSMYVRRVNERME